MRESKEEQIGADDLYLPVEATLAVDTILGVRHSLVLVSQSQQLLGLTSALVQESQKRSRRAFVLRLSEYRNLDEYLNESFLDAKTQKLKSQPGQLSKCLQQGELLIIIYDVHSFAAIDESFNCLFDDEPVFKEIKVHPQLQIIGILPAQRADFFKLSKAFPGRYLQVQPLHEKTDFNMPILPKLTEEQLKNPEVLVIDCEFKKRESCKELLLGQFVPGPSDTLTWQPGKLTSILESEAKLTGKSKKRRQMYTTSLTPPKKWRIVFKNLHPDAQSLLTDLRLSQMSGQTISLNNFQYSLTNIEFCEPIVADTKEWSLRFKTAKLQVCTRENIDKLGIFFEINHENVEKLFSLLQSRENKDTTKRQWIYKDEGIFAYLTKLLHDKVNWVITADLAPEDWYLVARLPATLYILDNVPIPEVLKPLTQKYLPDDKAIHEFKFVSKSWHIITPNIAELMKKFRMDVVIYLSQDHSFNSLICDYDQNKQPRLGVLWRMLQAGKRVLLVGLAKYPALAQELQSLWGPVPLIDINGEIILRQRGELFIVSDNTTPIPEALQGLKLQHWESSKMGVIQCKKNNLPPPEDWAAAFAQIVSTLPEARLIICEGPTGVGKTEVFKQLEKQKIAQIFGPTICGPLTTYDDFHDTVMDWARPNPLGVSGYRIWCVDEYDCLKPEVLQFLRGLSLGMTHLVLPCATGEVVLSSTHRVILTGNSKAYAGRYLHAELREIAAIIEFPKFKPEFLQKNILLPQMADWKMISPENKIWISEVLMELQANLQSWQVDVGVRELSAILGLYESLYAAETKESTKTPAWKALFSQACASLLVRLAPNKRAVLRQWLRQRLGVVPESTEHFQRFYAELSKTPGFIITEDNRLLAEFIYNDLRNVQYWQTRGRTPPGNFGVLISGPTGVGKDYLLGLILAKLGEKLAKHYLRFTGGVACDVNAVIDRVSEGDAELKKIIISEIDLLPGGMVENLLGKFIRLLLRVYATANGESYQGRQIFSPALFSRLQVFLHGDFSDHTLRTMLEKLGLSLTQINRVLALHAELAGQFPDTPLSSRQPRQVARLVQQGVDFERACKKNYALWLIEQEAKKSSISWEKSGEDTPGPFDDYLAMSTVVPKDELRPAVIYTEPGSRVEYDLSNRLLTLPGPVKLGENSDTILFYVILSKLTFELPKEQSWLSNWFKSLLIMRSKRVLVRYYPGVSPGELNIAAPTNPQLLPNQQALYTEVARRMSEDTDDIKPFWRECQREAQLIISYISAFIDCIPNELTVTAWREVNALGNAHWQKLYAQIAILKAKLATFLPQETETKIVDDEGDISFLAGFSGIASLGEKTKPYGRVVAQGGINFKYLPASIVHTENSRISLQYGRYGLKPLAADYFLDEKAEGNLDANIYILEKLSAKMVHGKLRFRLFVPEGARPQIMAISITAKPMIDFDDHGFYFTLPTLLNVKEIAEVKYQLLVHQPQMESKILFKPLAFSKKNIDSLGIDYSQDFKLAALKRKIIVSDRADIALQESLINELLIWFKENTRYANPKTDKQQIQQFLAFYRKPTTDSVALTNLYIRLKVGACVEANISLWSMLNDLFPMFRSELFDGVTAGNGIIKSVGHLYVVVSLSAGRRVLDAAISYSSTAESKADVMEDQQSRLPSMWLCRLMNTPPPSKERLAEQFAPIIVPDCSFLEYIHESNVLPWLKTKVFPSLYSSETSCQFLGWTSKPPKQSKTRPNYLRDFKGLPAFPLGSLEVKETHSDILLLWYNSFPEKDSKQAYAFTLEKYLWQAIIAEGFGVYIFTNKGWVDVASGQELMNVLPHLQYPSKIEVQQQKTKLQHPCIEFDEGKVMSIIKLFYMYLVEILGEDQILIKNWQRELLAQKKVQNQESKKLTDFLMKNFEKLKKDKSTPVQPKSELKDGKAMDATSLGLHLGLDENYFKFIHRPYDTSLEITIPLLQDILGRLKLSQFKNLYDIKFYANAQPIGKGLLPLDLPKSCALHFSGYRFQQSDLQALLSGCSVYRINFENCIFVGPCQLPDLPRLESLDFKNCGDNLPVVTRSPRFKSISFNFMYISPAIVRGLDKYPLLDLTISNCQLPRKLVFKENIYRLYLTDQLPACPLAWLTLSCQGMQMIDLRLPQSTLAELTVEMFITADCEHQFTEQLNIQSLSQKVKTVVVKAANDWQLNVLKKPYLLLSNGATIEQGPPKNAQYISLQHQLQQFMDRAGVWLKERTLKSSCT